MESWKSRWKAKGWSQRWGDDEIQMAELYFDWDFRMVGWDEIVSDGEFFQDSWRLLAGLWIDLKRGTSFLLRKMIFDVDLIFWGENFLAHSLLYIYRYTLLYIYIIYLYIYIYIHILRRKFECTTLSENIQYRLQASWTSRDFLNASYKFLSSIALEVQKCWISNGQLNHWRNGCQVILSLKVHSNDALAVKTAQILVCYNIDVSQSTLIIKLFPPLDDQPVGLQFKGNNHIIDYANSIQFWGRPPVHFPIVLCSSISLACL